MNACDLYWSGKLQDVSHLTDKGLKTVHPASLQLALLGITMHRLISGDTEALHMSEIAVNTDL